MLAFRCRRRRWRTTLHCRNRFPRIPASPCKDVGTCAMPALFPSPSCPLPANRAASSVPKAAFCAILGRRSYQRISRLRRSNSFPISFCRNSKISHISSLGYNKICFQIRFCRNRVKISDNFGISTVSLGVFRCFRTKANTSSACTTTVCVRNLLC